LENGLEKRKKACGKNLASLDLFGGDKRDRTADLLNAIQALSQLSYTPMIAEWCFPLNENYYTVLSGKLST
jgi:hypothetical protein